MRNDLTDVYQEVTGETLTGYEFTPKHASGEGVIRKALNWLIGRETYSSKTMTSSQAVRELAVTSADRSNLANKKSIAILPFKNLTKDIESRFYEFSLADALITELAAVKSLIVRPSSVIAKYQGKDINPEEVGKELNVDSVLSASFIRSGNKMRVNAQLLDVNTSQIIWSDRIDAESEDIFTLQDIICKQIVEGLKVELTPKELEKLGQAPTQNPQAYEEYLRGRDLFGRFIFHSLSNEDCEAAILHFKRAIELDPHFALAYSGLGACYANRVFKGIGTAEDYNYAETAFSKAIMHDPNIAEARVLMVFVYLFRGEKKKAQAELKLLTEQFPNEAPLYFLKGTIHRLNGEYEASMRCWDKLGKLDPAARVVSSYNKARIYLYQGLYEKALEELDKGTKLEPHHPLLKIFRGAVLYRQGNKEEGLKLFEEVLRKNPQMDGIRPLYAAFLANYGLIEQARAQLTEKAQNIAKADHDIAYWMAMAKSQIGEIDESIKWIEKAVKLGYENIHWFMNDSMLEPVRKDPRFQEIIKKITQQKSAGS
jgi:TolB-like protein/tetratricopeptide (TPR) repeat protein